MITNYKNFIFESLISESIIYYTPPVTKLLELLSEEGNLIAKALLDVAGTNVKPDITFVDFGDKDGYLEFSTMRNAQRLIGDKYEDYLKDGIHDLAKVTNLSAIIHLYNSEVLGGGGRDTGVFDTSRNPIKIGRMINSIFPSRFNAKDIEDFVRIFKSRLEKMGERFELIEGDAIGEWYHYTNYKEISGDLGRSCMCRKSGSFFEFYNENPEVCKMLILLDKEELIGRALIWKTNEIDGYGETLKDVFFMDRQYTILDSDVEKFIRYAKEQKWAYKIHNNHYSINSVSYNDQEFNADITVQMGKIHGSYNGYNNYPYLDTFKIYDPETGILYNSSDKEDPDNNGRFLLEDTDGDYEEINDNVWSEWHSTDIEREEAVWSEPLDDWIMQEHAVRIERGSGADSWYPENHNDVIYVDSLGEYVHRDDCYYSEYDDEYVYDDDAVNGIADISEDGEIETSDTFNKNSKSIYLLEDIKKDDKGNEREWYSKLETNYPEWAEYPAIFEGLVTLDYKKEHILSIFMIDTFIVKSDIEKKHFYLTREDAKLFGYELEKDDSHRKTDWFDYYKEIISYKDDINLFRNKPFITIEDIYNKLKKDEDNNSKRISFLEEYYYDYLPESE